MRLSFDPRYSRQATSVMVASLVVGIGKLGVVVASSVGREGCVGQAVDDTCDGVVEAGSEKLKGLFRQMTHRRGKATR
jgi:hypothetical protein